MCAYVVYMGEVELTQFSQSCKSKAKNIHQTQHTGSISGVTNNHIVLYGVCAPYLPCRLEGLLCPERGSASNKRFNIAQ